MRISRKIALLVLLVTSSILVASPAVSLPGGPDTCKECGLSAGLAICKLYTGQLGGAHICRAWTECNGNECQEKCWEEDFCMWA